MKSWPRTHSTENTKDKLFYTNAKWVGGGGGGERERGRETEG